VRAEQSLRAVAATTGGEYFRANDGAALLRAWQRIDALERAPVESLRYRRYHEGYVPLALAGLACWAAVVLLESTVWRRVP
jgi:Ca-activated chloride channel family protein